MKRIATTILLVCFAATPASANWSVTTNVKTVRRLLVDSLSVWAVTQGGLYRQDTLYRIDTLMSESYEVFNSGSGLGDHDLWAAARDRNVFWLGGARAVLTRFEPAGGAAARFPLALGVGKIESLLSDGDTLWVGADIGVGIFLKSTGAGLFKEVYTRLGSLPAEVAAIDMAFYRGFLWVLTPFGIVSADPDNPSLHVPGSWTDYADPDGGLAAGRRLEVHQDSLYVASDSGLYVLVDSLFQARLTDRQVRDLFSDFDTLWLATDSGVYFNTVDTLAHHQATNFGDSRIDNIARVPGQDIWLSAGRNNLFTFGSGGPWWLEIVIDQPHGTAFGSIDFLDGYLYAAQPRAGAEFRHTDGWWWTLPGIQASPSAPLMQARATAVDMLFASWGHGLYRFDLVGNSFSLRQYTALNSALAPVVDDTAFTVVTAVAPDAFGGIWAANRQTANGQSLVYFAPDDTTQLAFDDSDGLAGNRLNVLLLTDRVLWIGYDGAGLGALDFAGTPLDKSDDVFHLYTSTRDGLPSDVILALERDARGLIWVGTPGGLARVDPEFFPFISLDVADVRPASSEILALVIERAGGLWVGTGTGLAYVPGGTLAADSTWFEGSSALPNNRVLSLAIDDYSPTLWIGTQNGIASRSILVALTSSPPNVYPNPFHIRHSGAFAQFDVPAESRLDIFTLAGDYVRTLGEPYRWDGRNEHGTYVASGLYLFRVKYPDGTEASGRLGVVR